MRAAAAAATLLVALAVLVAAAVAGGGRAAQTSGGRPPQIQSSELLQRAGGTLWWVDRGCHLQRLRTRDLLARRAPGVHCRAWPSPDGATVLASDDDPSPGFGPAPHLAVLNGRSLRRVTLTRLRADAVVAPVTWSPDGVFAAFCYPGSHGAEVLLLVSPWRSPTVAHGRCHPSYTVASTALTTDGRHIYEGGSPLQLDSALAQAVGNPVNGVQVTALAATRDGLLAAVQGRLEHGSPGLAAVVDIDRRSGASTTVATGGDVTELGVAPDARAFWYRQRRDQLVQLVVPDSATSPEPAVANGVPAVSRAFAWSPSGRYLAVARAHDIEVYDRQSGRSSVVANVTADSLSWTR